MGAARDHALGGSQSLQIPPVPADEAAIGLSVVIPAFNEELRIGTSIDVVCDYLNRAGRTWELIIVDDGSSDLTAEVATAIDAEGTARTAHPNTAQPRKGPCTADRSDGLAR